MTNWFEAIKNILIIAVSHSMIELFSCFLNKKFKQTLVLIGDQILHIGILFFAYKTTTFYPTFDGYIFSSKTILTVLLLMVPCSIFISKLFEDLYCDNVYNGIFDIGSIIGILERFLVIIFALFKNFAAIAIIITVKTWARTDDLKEPNFRNKYLLGTLASLVLALFCYILFDLI